MNKKNIYFYIILVLSIFFLSSTYFGFQRYKSYKALNVEMLSDTEIEKNQDLDFINKAQKYTFAEIDNNLYYGYKNMYEKDDILFFSLVSSWDDEKLEELANEIYANKHGEEMGYLEKVIVYGSSDGVVAGSHYQSIYLYELPVALYNFLPEDLEFGALYEKSSISIYGVTEDTKIEDLAVVLSHEYGHHYTFYHFNIDGDEDDLETEYYKLRANGIDDIITDRDSYADYIDKHKWYLAEIAAEDYVYLMGSENTQKVVKFYDNYDKAQLFKKGQMTILDLNQHDYTWCRNGMPHENVELPMPVVTDGLADYFYSFIDEENPFEIDILDIGTLNLNMTVPESLYEQHNFTWDKPYTDHDVIYTLIAYDMEDNMIKIIKTVHGDENAVGRLGVYCSNADVVVYGDLMAFEYKRYEQMKLRVTITFPDGMVLVSDPIVIEY